MLNDLGVIHVNNHWLKKVTLAPSLENYVPSLLPTLAGDTSQHSIGAVISQICYSGEK